MVKDEPMGFSGGDSDKGESPSNSMAKKNLMKPPSQNFSHSSKRKNKKSPWWQHYDEVADENHVKCKYCGTMIGCASKNGTSALKNHIGRCKKFSANDSAPSESKYDPEAARKALIKMVIVDEHPFTFVENMGFLDFMKYCNPAVEFPSSEDVEKESCLMFENGRDKLKNVFRKLSSRVSLTTDAWTCVHGFCYMRLTARFIDDDWVLRKSIIDFTALDDYSGESIGTYIQENLDEWGIQKLMAVTVENADSNDSATDYLRKKLNDSGNSIILNGKYLHIRCFAQVLNSVVKDGLKELNVSLSRVRFVLRHVWSPLDRLQKLKALVEEEGLSTDGLIYMDDPERWDSTYLMIQSALKYQDAYKSLVRSFSSSLLEDIKECGDEVPTDEDWAKLNSFLPILKICCDATKILFRSRSLTCTDYVNNVFAIGLAISKCCNVEDEVCRKMAEQLKLKYDQYWGDADEINHLLFVALLFDPRRKMKYVEWIVGSNFEDSKAQILILRVKALMTELFKEYDSPIPEASSSSTTSPVKGMSSNESFEGKMLNFSKMLNLKYEREMSMSSLGTTKTELDKYLEDPCEPDVPGFSVLNWWKAHQKKYPILAKIARDVLAISMSTVYANSAFLSKGPSLDSYRSELSFDMLKVLVCTKDWIFDKEVLPLMEEESYTLDELIKDAEEMKEEMKMV